MSEGAEVELARAQGRVGQVLKEKWTLDRLLGVGGMGAVYAATHRNKKRGALKILHPELSAESSIRQRFLREGYVANSVGHRGAVEVFDDDIAEDGSAYLVMELLEGESVEHRWERKGRKLPAREVLAIADQLLDTLAEAHGKDIVHRDIKPENLFLQKGGVLKVLDFGIARLRETGKSATATQTGSAMGTPAFMAPEQARGRWEDVDGKTDLWAVGASMFTLLTGNYVHGGGTVNEIMARAITQPAPTLASVDASADPALAAFVDKALAYLPKDRFLTALEMQTALRELYHSLKGPGEMRPVQPSVSDGGGVPSAAAPQVIDAPIDAPATAATSPSSGGTAVMAVSNATLTTGRPMVTSSSSVAQATKPGLPKWLPLAGGGAVVAAVALVLLLRGGDAQPGSPAAASAISAVPAASAATVTPTLASDAPSPPEPAAKTVDLNSLPKLEGSAQRRATPAPVAALSAQPSKPSAELMNAINPYKPSAAQAPPAAKPTLAKPSSTLFKSRQ